ncbi:MAG: phosphotransferase [Syntrophorhabdus sp.]|nr:phosphotransferase [Syntrophorhabdus sp.]
MKDPDGLTVASMNGIEWHLDDRGLIEVLRPFSHRGGERRAYGAYPFRAGRVFVKSFLEKGLLGAIRNRVHPRGRVEYLMSRRLASLGISTPVSYGYGSGPGTSCVVHEYIEGESFIDVFHRSGDRGKLIAALAELLKTLERHHVLHNDLHLHNVLVANGRLYLIDLHKMKIKGSFTGGDEISNLSHALAMAYWTMTPDEKETFFRCYGKDGIRDETEQTLRAMHMRWILRKQRRAFENTSKTRREGRHLLIVGREDSGRGTYLETIKKDAKVVVERYTDHVRKIYRGRRRLRRAWKAHIALAYLNLPLIPETFRLSLPALFRRGYIAMEDLGGKGEELDRHVDRVYDGASVGQRKALADSLALFLKGAMKTGVVHRDLKACNVFRLDDGTFRFLDVEDITFHEADGDVLHRMLLQLNTTLPKRIGPRDRLRFLARLTSSSGIDRRQLLERVVRDSAGREIVYQGMEGLRTESW